MAVKKARLLSVLVIFVVAMIGLIVSKSPYSSKKPMILESQENVQHDIRITVTPQPLKPATPICFNIRLESFEHSDAIHESLIDTAMLVSESMDTFLPKEWIIETSSDHLITGQLLFDFIPNKNSHLELTLFVDEEFSFIWSAQTSHDILLSSHTQGSD